MSVSVDLRPAAARPGPGRATLIPYVNENRKVTTLTFPTYAENANCVSYVSYVGYVVHFSFGRGERSS